MRILIFAPPEEKSNAYQRFIKTTAKKLAKEKGVNFIENRNEIEPGVSFIFFKTVDPSFFNLWWIYHIKIPLLAKKMKADEIISLTGETVSSVISQKIVFPAFQKEQRFYWRRHAIKRLCASTKKASAVYHYKYADLIPAAKALLLQPFLFDKLTPLPEEERFNLKIQHTKGNEFFFASFDKMNEGDFILLLKAFSKFKKWQLSNMQLLIDGSRQNISPGKLSSYKYRSDIHFTDDADNTIKAAAYAFIHITNDEADVLPVLKSFQLSVPVLISKIGFIEETFNEACLLFNNNNVEELSGQMINIYKDELKRSQLISRGKLKIQELNRVEAKQQLWQLLS